MSDEPTKDIAEKYDTKPTIETVLERINALGAQLNARVDSLEEQLNARVDNLSEQLNARVDGLAEQLNARVDRLEEQLDIRLDRIESEVKLTHSEVYALRADFKELKSDLKVHEAR